MLYVQTKVFWHWNPSFVTKRMFVLTPECLFKCQTYATFAEQSAHSLNIQPIHWMFGTHNNNLGWFWNRWRWGKCLNGQDSGSTFGNLPNVRCEYAEYSVRAECASNIRFRPSVRSFWDAESSCSAKTEKSCFGESLLFRPKDHLLAEINLSADCQNQKMSPLHFGRKPSGHTL